MIIETSHISEKESVTLGERLRLLEFSQSDEYAAFQQSTSKYWVYVPNSEAPQLPLRPITINDKPELIAAYNAWLIKNEHIDYLIAV